MDGVFACGSFSPLMQLPWATGSGHLEETPVGPGQDIGFRRYDDGKGPGWRRWDDENRRRNDGLGGVWTADPDGLYLERRTTPMQL